ncbi:DUF3368 domain-containing protein [Algoriphagus marincola]|uniref:DUF3368 domain-containing protein n=1 Tax=Algoriphagus marincola TaxID=264027 RepID=UPI000684030E|nr:DUF3368 domain-containing protein [Algoriphagus marincola]
MKPSKIIIADTSCLIILEKIGQLELLQVLDGEIVITSTIQSEFQKPVPRWIKIEDPQKTSPTIIQSLLDPGEMSAISLALEKKNTLLILDDDKARKYAKQLTLKYTGTLGVILEAKRKGKINSVIPILDAIKKTNFRISPKMEACFLYLAGE